MKIGRLRNLSFGLALTFAVLAFGGCSGNQSTSPSVENASAEFRLGERPNLLSAYALWEGDMVDQVPAEGVIPYDLNSPLFSDYAYKYRFVKLPPGESAEYRESDVFEFPVGTVIAKTFGYPEDMQDEESPVHLVETRILVHQPDGWAGYPYLWNDEQTDATLKLTGKMVDVDWVHTDGNLRTVNYIVPNANQCKGCHETEGKSLKPIGPRARQLNKDFVYHDGTVENQLSSWSRVAALKGAPEDPETAERLAVWNDESTGTLNERARAWLEINCAHCHSPTGPARTSGLHLAHDVTLPSVYGVYKTPVAAGRGSGGHRFGIVPGKPEESILYFRINSDHPGVMMPELGKRLVHAEGVELIREWIVQMKDAPKLSANATEQEP